MNKKLTPPVYMYYMYTVHVFVKLNSFTPL